MRMDAFENITSLRIALQGEGLPGHGLALALGASNSVRSRRLQLLRKRVLHSQLAFPLRPVRSSTHNGDPANATRCA